MEKLHYRDNSAFSLIEMMAVLFIVGILIIILSMITISNYSKYKDRMALNEVISDIYLVQSILFIQMVKKYGKKYHVVVGHYLMETQLDWNIDMVIWFQKLIL